MQQSPRSAGFVRERARRSAPQDALDHLGREAAAGEKSRLRRPLGRVFRRLLEAALAHRGGALQLRLGERLRDLGRESDAVLRQLGADAPVAEAGLAGMDPRFGKALGGKEAVRLEPVEQGLDLRMAAIAVVAAVALVARFAPLGLRRRPPRRRPPGRAPRPRRGAAAFPAARAGSGRAAPAAAARGPSATAGRAGGPCEPPASRSVLDDLELGRRFRFRAGQQRDAHSQRAPCSRSRPPDRGSRAGTRARCPCPGRSSRRCRRTRSRSSRAPWPRRPCR